MVTAVIFINNRVLCKRQVFPSDVIRTTVKASEIMCKYLLEMPIITSLQ